MNCRSGIAERYPGAGGLLYGWKVVEAVLYPGNKGLQAEGLSLSASAPCAVLIREEAGEIVVSVTDACMNAALKGIRIVLNGRKSKYLCEGGCFVENRR